MIFFWPGLAVDMSSVTPEEAKACHRFAQERGVHFLDAPVSGGEPKAIDGTLAFMIGGTQAAFDADRPLLTREELVNGHSQNGGLIVAGSHVVCTRS